MGIEITQTVLQDNYVHYHSNVWGHPGNSVFSVKSHTFIHHISCKMNEKYRKDINKVKNNDIWNIFFPLNFAHIKESFKWSSNSNAELWHSKC